MDIAQVYIDKLIDREGGYVNNPEDHGGETNFGITIAVAREAGYTGPMVSMPRATAADIYYQKYWIKPAFYRIASLLPKVAEELLDTGVNMGVDGKLPQQWLQRSLNLCNRRGKDYADITVDGIIGQGTCNAIQGLISKRGSDIASDLLLKSLNGFQWERYKDICENGGPNSSQEDFFCGWVENRIGALS